MSDPLLSPLHPDEQTLVAALIAQADLAPEARVRIDAATADLVRQVRDGGRPGMMEVFLAEYGLSTDEGIALMCLAEALLRVPDTGTMDALIEDKIAPSDWGRHLGHSASPLVNASTWALMLTGRVLDDSDPGVAGHLRAAVKRLGEPVIRTAVSRAMKEMGRQFVLGETIGAAMGRAAAMESRGYAYSYDMLGEAARTEADALRYLAAYGAAIEAIGTACKGSDIRANPGISVKLSALHPRYEESQRARVMRELVPRLGHLARMAARRGMGLTIDAEEQDRLALSRDVIADVLADPALDGWDGFGVVVQAYGLRAGAMIDALHAMAVALDRQLTIRLVKGAYWDAEVKRAQVLGLPGFPVFTAKTATDISYLANARKLLAMTDRFYPQFATHNAHTVAALRDMARGLPADAWEFQRLHGMGDRLHDIVLRQGGTRCRIYAPVGAHRDLLAYLVRRLLENGANSSFVNRIVDDRLPPDQVAPCPLTHHRPRALTRGSDLFAPERTNARGWDLTAAPDRAAIDAARAPFAHGDPQVATVDNASPAQIDAALTAARPWDASTTQRARILNAAADLFEDNHGRIFALLTLEACKTLPDCIAELREAVDFLRYYAARITPDLAPRGRIACISPWNFPLAIFTGQVAGALASGNAVLAKPAEQTPRIAALAVDLLHQAGVPASALHFLAGDGATVGAALTRDARVDGVVFTGSTATARRIAQSMADHLTPGVPLIAETGGINAMIVDSTALPEQAVRDILASAFQSAGQRCSALRCLYVQDDIADDLLSMLFGAMDTLVLGNPWDLATDVGPLIDGAAAQGVRAYVAQARREGRVLHEVRAPRDGNFVAPVVIAVPGIAALDREVFGPVLHVARFAAGELPAVLTAINNRGYGLTFGLHTRIDNRVQEVVQALRVGNLYVNRNQIGAVVGSQPFGGEGLSGTGPKAGGPLYVARLAAPDAAPPSRATTLDMPGPTGESNRLSLHRRGPVLCLGPGPDAEAAQATAVRALGGTAHAAQGADPVDLAGTLPDLATVLWWGDEATGRALAQTLARRDGPLVALVTTTPDAAHIWHERHLSIDTTASGGNAQLLASAGDS